MSGCTNEKPCWACERFGRRCTCTAENGVARCGDPECASLGSPDGRCPTEKKKGHNKEYYGIEAGCQECGECWQHSNPRAWYLPGVKQHLVPLVMERIDVDTFGFPPGLDGPGKGKDGKGKDGDGKGKDGKGKVGHGQRNVDMDLAAHGQRLQALERRIQTLENECETLAVQSRVNKDLAEDNKTFLKELMQATEIKIHK